MPSLSTPVLLEEYGGIARAASRRYLDVHADRGAEYLGSALREYPQRSGRSLRSSLCIAVARCFGASLKDALNSAVALELLHNAFLVHDDIEDDSEERRGRPTLHVMHGVPIAVNVGDALVLLSLRPLLDNRQQLGLRVTACILEEVERMASETIEGQAIELGWRRWNTIDLGQDDYLRMVLKKTCWYTTIFPHRAGALIGTRRPLRAHEFVHFGFFVGAAFQIQDDILNLIGDPKRYGKELNGDLWEGKRTLMMIQLLNVSSSNEREQLTRFLGLPRHEKSEHEVRWVRKLLDHYGCIDYARGLAHGLAGAADKEFEVAFAGLPESRDLTFIRELPTWVLTRS
jgi:geranylgeranyl diphosphate synthase type II